MIHTVISIYQGFEEAEQAITELQAIGYNKNISVSYNAKVSFLESWRISSDKIENLTNIDLTKLNSILEKINMPQFKRNDLHKKYDEGCIIVITNAKPKDILMVERIMGSRVEYIPLAHGDENVHHYQY